MSRKQFFERGIRSLLPPNPAADSVHSLLGNPGAFRRCFEPRAHWLWKKPSMAFFHESEPQKSQGFSRFATAASSGE
jgi:hypothetical protein